MVGTADVKGILWILFYCGLLALVGAVDYVTGPRLAFFPFYIFVLVFIALRTPWTVAMLYALLAAVVFLTVDLMTDPAVTSTVFPYWRGLGQLISFGLVSFTIPKLMEERQRLTKSEGSLMVQKAELQELNAKLIGTLEDLSAAKQATIEDLLRRHIVVIMELKETLEQQPSLFKDCHELRMLAEKIDRFLAATTSPSRLRH